MRLILIAIVSVLMGLLGCRGKTSNKTPSSKTASTVAAQTQNKEKGPAAAKTFKLDKSQIKQLIPNMGGCIATDKITVEGKKVGFMYRTSPINDADSGWQFTAGDESQEYMDDPKNSGIYAVNTICNYDPSIIPFLNSPVGSSFIRDPKTGNFVKDNFVPPKD